MKKESEITEKQTDLTFETCFFTGEQISPSNHPSLAGGCDILKYKP